MARKTKRTAASTVRNIRRNSRKKYSGEEKIRIVLEGLRGEDTVAELCRREGISESVYYRWSREFLEAGRQRLVGNTKRQATRTNYDRFDFHGERDSSEAESTLLFNNLQGRGRNPSASTGYNA